MNKCWKCGEKISDHLHMNSIEMRQVRLPAPGDVSICGGCGAIHVFDEHMILVKPPADVMLRIERTPEIQDMRERLVKRHS